MNRHLVVSILFIFSSLMHKAICQDRISGKIIDDKTTESVPNASVYNISQEEFVFSDNQGYFSLVAAEGDSIQFQYLGYKNSLYIVKSKDQNLRIRLQPKVMDDIVITGKRSLPEKYNTNIQQLKKAEIIRTSFLAGEPDVMQALQTLPGVGNTREAMSGIVVRGGLPDQNMVIIDGVRMYNYTHLLGFLSMFNGDMVKNVDLYKGNIPSRYGSKSSSVIDVNFLDGNLPKAEGKIGIGLISSKLYYNTPIIKDKLNIVAGLRVSYLDLITLRQRIQYNNGDKDSFGGVGLSDLTIRSTYKMANNQQLSLTILNSKDQSTGRSRQNETEAKGSTKWKNQVYSLGYINPINSKSLLKLQGGFYKYSFSNYDIEKETTFTNESTFISSLQEMSLSGSISTHISTQWDTEVGFNIYSTHIFPYDIYEITNGEVLEINKKGQNIIETAIYQQVKFNHDKWIMDIGLREAYILKKVYVMPRFNVGRKYDQLTISAAYDRNYQYLNEIQPLTLSVAPINVWNIHDDNVSISNQYSGSITYQISDEIKLDIGVFKKDIKDLPIFNKIYRNVSELENLSSDDFVIGTLNSIGLEASSEFNCNRLNARLSITLANSTTTIPGVIEDYSYPTDFNRTFDFNINAGYRIFERFNLGVNMNYKTGQPITLPTNAYYSGDKNVEYIFSEINNGQYPDYFRVDISLIYRKSKKSTWSASLYNATNRRNPFNIAIKREIKNGVFGDTYYQGQSLFRALPTISYERSF